MSLGYVCCEHCGDGFSRFTDLATCRYCGDEVCPDCLSGDSDETMRGDCKNCIAEAADLIESRRAA